MCHIHTSIVSRHLATRGNNKILRTPPPNISNSEEILPRLDAPLLNSAQMNNLSSSYIYTKSTQNHIHHHYAPSVTLTHIIPSIAPTYAPHCHTLSDCTAGQMDGEAGWWTTSGKIRLLPLERVMVVGRQQEQPVILITESDIGLKLINQSIVVLKKNS